MRLKQTIFLHTIIWAAYFGTLAYYVDAEWEAKAEDKVMYWLHWSASRFGDVGFSYFIGFFVYGRFFKKDKIHWFILILIGTFGFQYVYDTIVWNWFKLDFLFNPIASQSKEILNNAWHTTITGTIFYVNHQWGLSHFRRKKMEDEVAQTELKFLKAQMSPHFLFNVFNNIYSLSLDENPNTSEAIGQLKSIMNYIQIFESKDEISLEEEERHLQQYIALNRLRHPLKVRLKSSFKTPSLKIEPMIFLPFFENAFKHGKTGEDDEIRAFIKEKDGIVNFEISNSIDSLRRKDSVSGVGLENIKKRLPYLYRDFLMDVIQDELRYKVKIRINLGKKVQL